MIKPTVGRVVWFYRHWPEGEHRPEAHQGPLAALISHVHSDESINVMVIDPSGHPSGFQRVALIQGLPPYTLPETDFCIWMPYQLGQAGKVEELQEKLSAKSA